MRNGLFVLAACTALVYMCSDSATSQNSSIQEHLFGEWYCDTLTSLGLEEYEYTFEEPDRYSFNSTLGTNYYSEGGTFSLYGNSIAFSSSSGKRVMSVVFNSTDSTLVLTNSSERSFTYYQGSSDSEPIPAN